MRFVWRPSSFGTVLQTLKLQELMSTACSVSVEPTSCLFVNTSCLFWKQEVVSLVTVTSQRPTKWDQIRWLTQTVVTSQWWYGSDELPFVINIVPAKGGAWGGRPTGSLWEELCQATRQSSNQSHRPQLVLRRHWSEEEIEGERERQRHLKHMRPTQLRFMRHIKHINQSHQLTSWRVQGSSSSNLLLGFCLRHRNVEPDLRLHIEPKLSESWGPADWRTSLQYRAHSLIQRQVCGWHTQVYRWERCIDETSVWMRQVYRWDWHVCRRDRCVPGTSSHSVPTGISSLSPVLTKTLPLLSNAQRRRSLGLVWILTSCTPIGCWEMMSQLLLWP